jgi:hypothetical protein
MCFALRKAWGCDVPRACQSDASPCVARDVRISGAGIKALFGTDGTRDWGTWQPIAGSRGVLFTVTNFKFGGASTPAVAVRVGVLEVARRRHIIEALTWLNPEPPPYNTRTMRVDIWAFALAENHRGWVG